MATLSDLNPFQPEAALLSVLFYLYDLMCHLSVFFFPFPLVLDEHVSDALYIIQAGNDTTVIQKILRFPGNAGIFAVLGFCSGVGEHFSRVPQVLVAYGIYMAIIQRLKLACTCVCSFKFKNAAVWFCMSLSFSFPICCTRTHTHITQQSAHSHRPLCSI